MTNFSLTNHPPAASTENDEYNSFNYTQVKTYVEQRIFSVFVVFVSIFGFLGNGIVIWLLGFRIKKNSFTVYILNLAAADLGVLLSMVLFLAVGHSSSTFIYDELIIFLFSTGQFLLTAISIDRCVCVLFPIWHQVHRPAHLSIIVCAVIWVFTFLLNATHFTLLQTQKPDNHRQPTFFQFFVNALLCGPFMILSALTLFMKIFLKPQQRQRGKLLLVIFVTLLLFFLFAFPVNAIYLHSALTGKHLPTSLRYGLFCASLNSSVNPLVYFLIGRQKKKRPGGTMKVILQRLFGEE